NSPLFSMHPSHHGHSQVTCPVLSDWKQRQVDARYGYAPTFARPSGYLLMVSRTGHPDIPLAGHVLTGVASIVVRGCLPDHGMCPVAILTTRTEFLPSVGRVLFCHRASGTLRAA